MAPKENWNKLYKSHTAYDPFLFVSRLTSQWNKKKKRFEWQADLRAYTVYGSWVHSFFNTASSYQNYYYYHCLIETENVTYEKWGKRDRWVEEGKKELSCVCVSNVDKLTNLGVLCKLAIVGVYQTISCHTPNSRTPSNATESKTEEKSLTFFGFRSFFKRIIIIF